MIRSKIDFQTLVPFDNDTMPALLRILEHVVLRRARRSDHVRLACALLIELCRKRPLCPQAKAEFVLSGHQIKLQAAWYAGQCRRSEAAGRIGRCEAFAVSRTAWKGHNLIGL